MLVLVLMVIRQRITRGSLVKSPVTLALATRRDRRSLPFHRASYRGMNYLGMNYPGMNYRGEKQRGKIRA